MALAVHIYFLSGFPVSDFKEMFSGFFESSWLEGRGRGGKERKEETERQKRGKGGSKEKERKKKERGT